MEPDREDEIRLEAETRNDATPRRNATIRFQCVARLAQGRREGKSITTSGTIATARATTLF
jgi:hypothetical protein